MTASVSNIGMSALAQQSMLKLQQQLTSAQSELSSGRVEDAGIALGVKEGQSISLRQSIDNLTALTATNAVVTTQLDATQAALGNIASIGSTFADTLVSAQDGSIDPTILQNNARQAMASFTELMNTTSAGIYLFAGQNSTVKPLSAFEQNPPSAAQQAIAAAFQSAFGVAVGSPGSAAITSTQMQQFLDNQFTALSADPAWKTDWSSADDQTTKAYISDGQIISTSVSANDQGFRQIASALSMVAGLGPDKLNAASMQTVIASATRTLQSGLQHVTAAQASVGLAQQNVTQVGTIVSQKMSVLNSQVDNLESVDPAQLSMQINAMQTQLEATYSLTARLQNLSLVKYL